MMFVRRRQNHHRGCRSPSSSLCPPSSSPSPSTLSSSPLRLLVYTTLIIVCLSRQAAASTSTPTSTSTFTSASTSTSTSTSTSALTAITKQQSQSNEQQQQQKVVHETDDSSTSASLQLPLEGGILHASGFFFNASIGEQHFTLQVDLSYSSLIIPSHNCQGCRVGDRRYHSSKSSDSQTILCSDARCHSELDTDCSAPVDPLSRSACYNCSPGGRCCVLPKKEDEAADNGTSSSSCAFNVLYGDGSTGNGSVYVDKLKLTDVNDKNDVIETNVLFGAMFEESHNFEMPYADGVFGLAFQKGACRPSCYPPLMDQISNATKMSNMFTLCVNNYGGMLTLGKADTSLLKPSEEFSYVDMVDEYKDNRFVIPSVTTWKVNDKSVDVPGITKVMFTAGISYIGISKTTFMAFVEHLMTYYCDVPGLCSTSSWFRPQNCAPIDDHIISMMPNITLSFTQRVSITLTPEDYLLPLKVLHGRLIRCNAFIVADTLAARGIGLLLGNTVYKRYAVVFDRGAKRVGFGLSAGAPVCGAINGSGEGLPSIPGEPGTLLTADAPAQPMQDNDDNNLIEQKDEREETCRALKDCKDCANNKNCSYGYQHGDCVPIEDSNSSSIYPYCHDGFCACLATGRSGWYVGIVLGVLLCLSFSIIGWLIWRKRQQRNIYRSVNTFEEQDLDTF